MVRRNTTLRTGQKALAHFTRLVRKRRKLVQHLRRRSLEFREAAIRDQRHPNNEVVETGIVQVRSRRQYVAGVAQPVHRLLRRHLCLQLRGGDQKAEAGAVSLASQYNNWLFRRMGFATQPLRCVSFGVFHCAINFAPQLLTTNVDVAGRLRLLHIRDSPHFHRTPKTGSRTENRKTAHDPSFSGKFRKQRLASAASGNTIPFLTAFVNPAP